MGPKANGSQAALTRNGRLLWRKNTAPDSEYTIDPKQAAQREVPCHRDTIQAEIEAIDRWIQMYQAIADVAVRGSW